MAELVISLKPQFSLKFKKQFEKLHPVLKKKFTKQINLLSRNPRHPSLKARKMGGVETYEARLDKHNRFTYTIISDEIWFLSIGPHDEGLGKK